MFRLLLQFANIIAAFTLVVLLFAFQARAEEPQHHCKIETGDVGNFHYRAVTMQEAMLKTSGACLDARNKLYIKLRGHEPTEDRQILFMDSCVNLNVCWSKHERKD